MMFIGKVDLVHLQSTVCVCVCVYTHVHTQTHTLSNSLDLQCGGMCVMRRQCSRREGGELAEKLGRHK